VVVGGATSAEQVAQNAAAEWAVHHFKQAAGAICSALEWNRWRYYGIQ
jgi:hypothetical protein